MNKAINPTNIKSTPPKLSKAQLDQLTAALEKLAAVDRKLEEINSLRDAVKDAAQAFALGKLSLLESAALAGLPPSNIAETRGALRAGCKAVQKQVMDERW